ncbi:MAG: helicase C-terminal domain-containing protein [Elusimicrobiota bacterium]|nr:helicase C-terminal domain-containing protein [Elusimicrobiota bacterium]
MWTYDAKFSQMSEKGMGEYFGAKDGDTKGAINSPNNRFMWKMLGIETVDGGDIYSSHDYDKLSNAHDRNNISAAAKGRVVAYALGNRGFVELTSRQNDRMNALFEKTDLKIVDEADVAALSRTAFIQGGGSGPTSNEVVSIRAVYDITKIFAKIQGIQSPDGNQGREVKSIETKIGWNHVYAKKVRMAAIANVNAKSKDDLAAWEYTMIDGQVVLGSELENAIILTFGTEGQKLSELKDVAAISQIFRAMYTVEAMHSDKESLYFTEQGQPVSVENGAVQENTTDQSSTYNVAAVIFELQVLMERDGYNDEEVAAASLGVKYKNLNPFNVKKSVSNGESTISQIFSRGKGRTLNCGGSATLDVAKEVSTVVFGGMSVNIMASSYSQSKRELGDKFKIIDSDAVVNGAQRLFDFFKNGGETYKAGQKMKNGQIAKGGELMIDGSGALVGLLFGAMDMSVNAAILTRALAMYIFYIENGREIGEGDKEAIEKIIKEIDASSTENLQTRIDYVKKYITDAGNSDNANKDKWTDDAKTLAFSALGNIQIMDANLAGKDPEKIAQMADIRGKVTISNINSLRGVDFKSINMVIVDGGNFPSSELLQSIGRAGRNADWSKEFASVYIYFDSKSQSIKVTYNAIIGDYNFYKTFGIPLFDGVNAWMNSLVTCISYKSDPFTLFTGGSVFNFIDGAEIANLPRELQNMILAKVYGSDWKGIEKTLKEKLNLSAEEVLARSNEIMDLAKNNMERINNTLNQTLLEFITVYRSMQLKSESILFKANQEANNILIKEPLAEAISQLRKKGFTKLADELTKLYEKSIQSKEGSLFSKGSGDNDTERKSPSEQLQSTFHTILANAKEFIVEAQKIIKAYDPTLAADFQARFKDVENMQKEGAFDSVRSEFSSEKAAGNQSSQYTFTSASRTALNGNSPARDVAKVLIALENQILPSQGEYQGDKLTYNQAVQLNFISTQDMLEVNKGKIEDVKISLKGTYEQDAKDYGTSQWNGLAYTNPNGDIVLTDKGKMLARLSAKIAMPDEKTLALLILLFKALGIDFEKLLAVKPLDIAPNLILAVDALQKTGFKDSKSFSELMDLSDNIDIDKLEDMSKKYYEQVVALYRGAHLVNEQISDEMIIEQWKAMSYAARTEILNNLGTEQYNFLSSLENPVEIPSAVESHVSALLMAAGFEYSGSMKEFIKQQYNKDNHKNFVSARVMGLVLGGIFKNNGKSYGEYGEIKSRIRTFFAGISEWLIAATVGLAAMVLGSLFSLITLNPDLIPRLFAWWISFFTEGASAMSQSFGSYEYTMTESEFLDNTYLELLERGERMMGVFMREKSSLDGTVLEFWTEGISHLFLKFGQEFSKFVRMISNISDGLKIKGWFTFTAGAVNDIANPDIVSVFVNINYNITASGPGFGAGDNEQNAVNLQPQAGQQELYLTFAAIAQDNKTWESNFSSAAREQIMKQNSLRFDAPEINQTAIDNMIKLYIATGAAAFAGNTALKILTIAAYVGAVLLISAILAVIIAATIFAFVASLPFVIPIAIGIFIGIPTILVGLKLMNIVDVFNLILFNTVYADLRWRMLTNDDNYREFRVNDTNNFTRINNYTNLIGSGAVASQSPVARGGHTSTFAWSKDVKQVVRGGINESEFILGRKKHKKVDKFKKDQIEGNAKKEMEKKNDVYKPDPNKKDSENKKFQKIHDKPYLDEAEKKFKYSIGDYFAVLDHLSMYSVAEQQVTLAALLPGTDPTVAYSRVQSLKSIPDSNLVSSYDELPLSEISNNSNWVVVENGFTFKNDTYIQAKDALKEFRHVVEKSLKEVPDQIDSGIKEIKNQKIEDIKGLRDDVIKALIVAGDEAATRTKILKMLKLTAQALGITENDIINITSDTTNEQIIENLLLSISGAQYDVVNSLVEALISEFPVLADLLPAPDSDADNPDLADQTPQNVDVWTNLKNIVYDAEHKKNGVEAKIYADVIEKVNKAKTKLETTLKGMPAADLKKIVTQIFGENDENIPVYDGTGDEKQFYINAIIKKYNSIPGAENTTEHTTETLLNDVQTLYALKQEYNEATILINPEEQDKVVQKLVEKGFIQDATQFEPTTFTNLIQLRNDQINDIIGKDALQRGIEASINNVLTSEHLSTQQKLDRATEIRDALAKAIAKGDKKRLVKYLNRASAEFGIGHAFSMDHDLELLKSAAAETISKLNIGIVKYRDYIKDSISNKAFETTLSESFFNKIAPLENAQRLIDASIGNGATQRLLNSMIGFTGPEEYNTALLRVLVHFNNITEMEGYLGLSGSYAEKDIVSKAFETYALCVTEFSRGEMTEEQLKRESEIIRMVSNVLIAAIDKTKGEELKTLINKDKLTQSDISTIQNMLGKDYKVNNNVFITNLKDYIDISFIDNNRAASAVFNIDAAKIKKAFESKESNSGSVSSENNADLLNLIVRGRRGKKNKLKTPLMSLKKIRAIAQAA